MLKVIFGIFLIFVGFSFIAGGGVGIIASVFGAVIAVFGAVFGIVAGLFGAFVGIAATLFALAVPLLIIGLIVVGVVHIVRCI